MDSKLITLITGANTGIGYETAKILLRSPDYHVLIGSRTLEKGTKAVDELRALPDTKGSVDAVHITIDDDASVDAAAASIKSSYGRLDILVNNAGICPEASFAGTNTSLPSSRETMRTTLNTNVAGSVSVTEAMLPLLQQSKSPRLVFVSSSTGSLTLTSDLTSPRSRVGRVEYRASKAALNFVMVQYWLALKDKGFFVAGADPGLNATNLTGDADSLKQRGAAPPDVGAERVAKVVRGDREEFAGKVCGEYEGGVVCPW